MESETRRATEAVKEYKKEVQEMADVFHKKYNVDKEGARKWIKDMPADIKKMNNLIAHIESMWKVAVLFESEAAALSSSHTIQVPMRGLRDAMKKKLVEVTAELQKEKEQMEKEAKEKTEKAEKEKKEKEEKEKKEKAEKEKKEKEAREKAKAGK